MCEMSCNQLSHPKGRENDMLTMLGHDLTIDEWIYMGIPCVLLYKDGLMDIYPVQEYTGYELTMLQRDSRYTSAWVVIGYGSFLEMQELMYERLREWAGAICSKPQEIK
jgi:hypothetical protein